MDKIGVKAHEQLINKITNGIGDKRRRLQLYLGTEGDREESEKAYSALPNGNWLLQEARRIKRESIEDLDDNIKRFTHAAQASGVHVHFAHDGATAVRIVMDLTHESRARRIVKAKSMTSEEIDLRQHLEEGALMLLRPTLAKE